MRDAKVNLTTELCLCCRHFTLDLFIPSCSHFSLDLSKRDDKFEVLQVGCKAHMDGSVCTDPAMSECLQLVVCSMRRPIRMDSTFRFLVVQIGANADRAKVFKAHAAPLGLCDNLINEPKLLANHQKDDDSPIQSIMTGLCERSGRGILMD